MPRANERELRVLILAPIGRDAQLLASTLTTNGIAIQHCSTVERLLDLIDEGAAVAIVTDEVLSGSALEELRTWLEHQPPWSDMPFIVLSASGRASLLTARRAEELL